MSTVWYALNADKIAKEKLDKHEKDIQESDLDGFYGRPPYHWTDSALTSMGLMAVMATELMFCVFIDLSLLAGILMVIL